MTERKPTCVACKGAGGADYTAGEGIKIESNEISADTTVLQPKLTAGDNITIADNVISVDGIEWKIVDITKWHMCIEDNVAKYDMILCIKGNVTDSYVLFFKKGCIITDINFKRTINIKGYLKVSKGQLFSSIATDVTPTLVMDTSYTQSNGILTITYDKEQGGGALRRLGSYSDYNTKSSGMLLLTKEDIE